MTPGEGPASFEQPPDDSQEIAVEWDGAFANELATATEQRKSLDELVDILWNRAFLDRLAPTGRAVREARAQLGYKQYDRNEPEVYDRIMFVMDQYEHAFRKNQSISEWAAPIRYLAMEALKHDPDHYVPELETANVASKIRMRAMAELHRLNAPPLPGVQPGTRGTWRGIPVVVGRVSDTGSPMLRLDETQRSSDAVLERNEDGTPRLTGSKEFEEVLALWAQDAPPRTVLAEFVPEMEQGS